MGGAGFGFRLIDIAADDARHARGGGEIAGLAGFEFLISESWVVVLGREDNRSIAGVHRLDNNATWGFAPPGTPGDLRNELEGAFLGSEVGDGERGVGVEYAHEGDTGEIESLCDHLGAEYELDIAL